MKIDNFETDIKHQMNSLEIDPPEEIWVELDQKLTPAYANSVMLKKYLGVMISGLVVLTAVVFFSQTDNQLGLQSDQAVRQDTIYLAGTSLSGQGFAIDSIMPGNTSAGVYLITTDTPLISEPIRTWLEDERLLVLYFYNNDCKHCLRFEEETLTKPSIRSILTESFKLVSLDTRDTPNVPLIKKYKIQTSPTLIFIDKNGLPNYRITGYQNESNLIEGLQAILAGKAIPEKDTGLANASKIEVAPPPRMFKIFPNPSQGKFQIEVNNPDLAAAKIQISTIHGQIVHQQKVDPVAGLWSKAFDLTQEEKGYYVIRIKRGEEVLTEKILIQ